MAKIHVQQAFVQISMPHQITCDFSKINAHMSLLPQTPFNRRLSPSGYLGLCIFKEAQFYLTKFCKFEDSPDHALLFSLFLVGPAPAASEQSGGAETKGSGHGASYSAHWPHLHTALNLPRSQFLPSNSKRAPSMSTIPDVCVSII